MVSNLIGVNLIGVFELEREDDLNQHNEQARAALKYSTKKTTRRDARHQADETRKRHNEKTKQHTRDETDTTTMENRIWSIEAAVANLRARSVRTLRDPALIRGGAPGLLCRPR